MPQQSSVICNEFYAKPNMTRKKSQLQVSNAIVNEEEHFCMVSKNAYYLTLSCDFFDGDPVHDWLIADEDIDSLLLD